MQFNDKSNTYNWDQNAYNPAETYGDVCYEVPSFCYSNQTAEMMNTTSTASHIDKNHLNGMFCENGNSLYENTQNAMTVTPSQMLNHSVELYDHVNSFKAPSYLNIQQFVNDRSAQDYSGVEKKKTK